MLTPRNLTMQNGLALPIQQKGLLCVSEMKLSEQ